MNIEFESVFREVGTYYPHYCFTHAVKLVIEGKNIESLVKEYSQTCEICKELMPKNTLMNPRSK